MKKGIIAVALVAALGAAGAGGYTYYNKQQTAKEYETKVAEAISSLQPIEIYENEDIPSIETEFAGTDGVIDITSVTPDISNVYANEPGEYTVSYTFKDTNGEERTATVQCTVKPDLESHVEGLDNITIDKDEEIPTEVDCTYDEYVSSVTLNAENVDTESAGIYDISYTILGTDGDMVTADGYTCTVNETADPTPTPTPKATATPTPTPEATEAPAEPDETEPAEVGNVEVQENVVETGDENNLIAIGGIIVVCIAAIGGVIVYRKKRNKNEE